MKKYFLFSTIIALTLFSCSKEEGEGGRSSISGKVHLTDNTGGIQGDYDVPDYDVFIIYGEDDDIFDDDTKTNFDGTFKFSNLREGSYRVFTYTADGNEASGLAPIFRAIELGGNDDATVKTIEVEK